LACQPFSGEYLDPSQIIAFVTLACPAGLQIETEAYTWLRSLAKRLHGLGDIKTRMIRKLESLIMTNQQRLAQKIETCVKEAKDLPGKIAK